MTEPHQQLLNTKRWVIKIGSALLTRIGEGLDTDRIRWLSCRHAEVGLEKTST